MAKYHINPETGNVNLCRAKKRCRFQREGEPPVAHYPTKGEAQAAYERSQEQVAASRSKRQGVAQGTVTEGELELLYRRYQEASDELVKAFQEAGGYRFPTSGFTYQAEEKLAGHEAFTFLGEGVDKAVFLHKPTGLVYKVIFARAGNGQYQQAYLHRYQEREQELVAALDDEKLATLHVRYARNYFLESAGVPVIAQEYLSPDEYYSYDLSSVDKPLNALLEKEGLQDMHFANCYRHRETGEIVLFDCLHLGGHIIREVTEDDHFVVEE